ncbi:MAG: ABC transporter permease [Aeromonadaceae bacterium]
MNRGVVAQRSEWQVFWDVNFALLLRELKTRYGEYRLGYAWALLDPLVAIGLFCVVFGLKQRDLFGDVEAPVFIASGYLPFLLFKNCCTRLQKAVSANQNLFCFRQVTPFTTLFTRFLLESLIGLMTLLILIIALLWCGFNALPAKPLEMLSGLLLLLLISFGLGTLFCIIATLFGEAEKFLAILMRPLMWISAVFHPLSVVPQEYHEFFLWNPLVHALELIRASWINHYPESGASWGYLCGTSLVCLCLAFSAYRLFHHRLVLSS